MSSKARFLSEESQEIEQDQFNEQTLDSNALYACITRAFYRNFDSLIFLIWK